MAGRNVWRGNYRTTPERDMAAFDKLPPSIRRALAESVEQWAAQPILTWFRKRRPGFRSSEEGTAVIKKWNAAALQKRETDRRAAKGPYKGNVPDPGYAKISRSPHPRSRRP